MHVLHCMRMHRPPEIRRRPRKKIEKRREEKEKAGGTSIDARPHRAAPAPYVCCSKTFARSAPECTENSHECIRHARAQTKSSRNSFFLALDAAFSSSFVLVLYILACADREPRLARALVVSSSELSVIALLRRWKSMHCGAMRIVRHPKRQQRKHNATATQKRIVMISHRVSRKEVKLIVRALSRPGRVHKYAKIYSWAEPMAPALAPARVTAAAWPKELRAGCTIHREPGCRPRMPYR